MSLYSTISKVLSKNLIRMFWIKDTVNALIIVNKYYTAISIKNMLHMKERVKNLYNYVAIILILIIIKINMYACTNKSSYDHVYIYMSLCACVCQFQAHAVEC